QGRERRRSWNLNSIPRHATIFSRLGIHAPDTLCKILRIRNIDFQSVRPAGFVTRWNPDSRHYVRWAQRAQPYVPNNHTHSSYVFQPFAILPRDTSLDRAKVAANILS